MRDAPPHFLFRLAEKKTGCTRKGYAASVSGKAANGCAIARSKRKGRFWRAPVQWPSARTGVGVPVQAPISPGLRARYALLRGRYCRPVADGADGVGVVAAWSCFSFRCRWPVVDDSFSMGQRNSSYARQGSA